MMATLLSNHVSRNKWENQKIKKYYIKQQQGVANRQHRFPKVSSNSARPWVRNWAKISKLECRVKHKNNCDNLCNEIQKYSQNRKNEMELTTTININTYKNDLSIPAATFPIITLKEYFDPILLQYGDDNYDECLQIAIHESLETYSSEIISKDALNSNNSINKQRKIDQLLPKVTPKKKNSVKQQNCNETNKNENEFDKISKQEYFKMDTKITINLDNILGVNYDNVNINHYATHFNQTWKCNKLYDKNFKQIHKFTALPYKLRMCNMEICIDDKKYSFTFTEHKQTEYSLTIDNHSYSFKISDDEEFVMNECNKTIPIYIEKLNHTIYPFSNYNDNQRLFQIAQKCFEQIISFINNKKSSKNNKKKKPIYSSTDIFIVPQWKYSNIHINKQNNSFIPIVCKLNDILSEYIPIRDILNDILIPYIGYSQFESVIVKSTINIKNKHKDELIEYMKNNEVIFDKGLEIELQSATNYGFEYIEPFSKFTTFVPSTTMYTYHAINYDVKKTEYPDYSKQTSKKCMVPHQHYFAASNLGRNHVNTIKSKHNELNDGIYDERQRIKDMKRRKLRVKKRKRRNRLYVVQPKIKHLRRKKRKQKYRKNVYHACSAKQKRLKSKKAKGILNKNRDWHIRKKWFGDTYAYCSSAWHQFFSKKGRYNVDIRPSYAIEYSLLYWCSMCGACHYQYKHLQGYKHAKTNKCFATKIGRKNTRLF